MRTKSRASGRLKWEVSEDNAARRPKLQRYVVSFIFASLWADQREVLLIRKRRPNWQKGSLNGLGGRVSDNELPKVVSVRTVLEECGLNLSDHLRQFAQCRWAHAGITLDCFTSTIADLHTITSLKDEKVSRYGYPEVLTRKDLVSGVSWLLPLAIDFNLDKVGQPIDIPML